MLSVITSRRKKYQSFSKSRLEVVLSVITSRQYTEKENENDAFGSSAICDYF